MRASSYPRRQEYRRLRRAIVSAGASAAAGGLAVAAAWAGATAIAGALLLLMGGLLVDARRWLHLAARSGVGARSEDAVRRALSGLEAEGWRLRHSLPYRGRGDIDSVAIAPPGIAFVVETKTRAFNATHLADTREMASWLHRHWRRWCRRGVLPVLCVVGATTLERIEDEVLVVSPDRLLPALRVLAGTSPRPGVPRRHGGLGRLEG
jgi:hypothetical protein